MARPEVVRLTPALALLWLSLISGALALALGLHARTRATGWSAVAARAHAGAMLGALALVLLAFLFGDLSYAYVWAHVDTTYPVWYRLAGLWGGEEGTVLLWNALVAVFALVVMRRASSDRGGVHARAALALLALSVALAIVNLASDGLAATDPERLAQSPRGRGLADVLLTPLMVIHPPIQFVAYALMAPVGAYVLAQWSRPRDTARDRAWSSAAYSWARAAWLFATVGLGLGALWAYYVLSFGGYWAWDPVETSNLLPWLALTGFLHAGKQHMRFGDHPVGAPLLALLAPLMAMFATLATRSGLWVSVHAFTDPTSRFEPDAGARLLAILETHAPSRLFAAYLVAALLGATALFVRHRFAATPPARVAFAALLALAGAALLAPVVVLSYIFEAAALWTSLPIGLALLVLVLAAPYVAAYLREADGGARRMLEPRALMTAAVALFAVALAVAFVLNLQVVNGPDRSVFDGRAPLVAAPMVSLLTIMLAQAPLGRRGAVALALGGLAAGVAGWILMGELRVVGLAAPVTLAAALAAILKLAHVQGRAASWRLRVGGMLLLGAGFFGILAWSNPPSRVLGVALPDAWAAVAGAAGLALSALTLVGAIAAFRARGLPLAVGGAAAGALAWGFGVGAMLAFLALPLLAWDRARFAPLRGFARGEASRIRETGIYLVHLALVIGLLGYAASTYAADRETFVAAPPGTEGDVGDLRVRLADEARIDAAADRVARVELPLLVEGGEPMRVAFAWTGAPSYHYVGELQVRRAPLEDLYVSPLAFRVDGAWVSAGGPTMAQLAPGDVEAVTFSVSRLPLMSLVWGGLWGMTLGMGFILAGAALAARPAPAAHARAAPEPGAVAEQA